MRKGQPLMKNVMDDKEIEYILENAGWEAISIQKDKNDKTVLILVCSSKSSADNLLRLLQTEDYNLMVKENPTSKVCEILIEFLNRHFAIGCDTGRTINDYPPLVHLYKEEIEYMTTGTFLGHYENGDALYFYNGLCSLLDKIHFN